MWWQFWGRLWLFHRQERKARKVWEWARSLPLQFKIVREWWEGAVRERWAWKDWGNLKLCLFLSPIFSSENHVKLLQSIIGFPAGIAHQISANNLLAFITPPYCTNHCLRRPQLFCWMPISKGTALKLTRKARRFFICRQEKSRQPIFTVPTAWVRRQ